MLHSLLFSIVVVVIMIFVDKFVVKTDETIVQQFGSAVFIGKKILDLLVGFLIGYYVLFKPKSNY